MLNFKTMKTNSAKIEAQAYTECKKEIDFLLGVVDTYKLE
jgi:hypothetical protein